MTASNAHLADYLDIMPTNTGMHTVAFLKKGLNAEKVAKLAAERGLTLTPIGRFCIAAYDRQAFALGFSGFSTAQIETAIRIAQNCFCRLDDSRRHAEPAHETFRRDWTEDGARMDLFGGPASRKV